MASLEGILNTDLNYPGIEIKVELIVMREYLTQMEAGIRAVCDGYIKEEEKNHSGAEYYEYQHIYQIAEDEIPRIIRMPFLITIYTLFENSITQLLNYAQEKENKALGLRDINGKTLSSKFSKYMVHVVNYDFQFNNAILERISIINKVRNCIAHANGNIDALSNDKIKALREIGKKNIGIYTSSNQLDISNEFLQESMCVVAEAIEGLMLFMESRYGFK